MRLVLVSHRFCVASLPALEFYSKSRLEIWPAAMQIWRRFRRRVASFIETPAGGACYVANSAGQCDLDATDWPDATLAAGHPKRPDLHNLSASSVLLLIVVVVAVVQHQAARALR